MKLLHNPRCSKSREALAALQDAGHTPEVWRYLDESLTEPQIRELLAQLGIAPLALVRTKEELWRELSSDKTLSDDDIIALLASHPKLIERPILTHNGKAAIGRPLENILALLD
ncbi:arsenate reductase (glutaredoxin) [Chitinibacter fontanus]|uniref:Arsenate reductase n=1 Tax=Chitinibacter fontanus TaxID=1737446 RepID=A0A7D5Z8X3_9NEIS|nr:arsenate reductase (glutaredoxin) [Chitinibacter fontanus]QLI80106.1 arsenate reductase (glutaredoxin) [Chitinibacter fontanus]